MINPIDLNDQRIAMLAWAKKPDQNDDVVVYAGTAKWRNQQLVMECDSEQSMVIQPDWYGRIEVVPDQLRETLLDAKFYFQVSVGAIKDASNPEELTKTSLRWPDPTE
ncbi:MAG: hypothetical protein ACF8OB_05065 [Phycisphaeraceae bacterium JB051]